MFQLIIVVIALALVATLANLGLNHGASWIPAYQRAEPVITKGFCRLERVALQAGLPTPLAEPDGGLVTLFSPQYQYKPAALPETVWVYGATDTNRKYICLKTPLGLYEGPYRALKSLARRLPEGQLVWGDVCGESGTFTDPVDQSYPAPGAATLFLTPNFSALSGLAGCESQF